MPRRGQVVPGLEVLARSRPKWLRDRRVGLLMHQASVTPGLESARDVLNRLCGRRLTALFGPQHGIAGEKQDNMIESAHGQDARLGIPIFSLYSETRRPTPGMLREVDILVVDLQDVGTRVYTFEWTTALALEACAEAGIPVVVLDRPNPLGGVTLEGNLIRPGYESFVGLHPVPMRHGLTLGEMATLVNARLARRPGAPRCDLTVVPMTGWRRRMRFSDTGLPWVLPSPNMPTPETADVYPGQVLLEGCSLSEGRGTTRPFEVWGAPWLDAAGLRERFRKRRLPGCVLRDHDFEPTFHKWQGQVCRGFQIHVTDRERFRPYLTTLSLLQDVIALHPDRFEWKQPPYEYVTDKLPIDVLTGDPVVRETIESGGSLTELAASWRAGIRGFSRESASHHLYR
ncbi:MAG TPA: DUF1343 domain-containing protein [Candidatus Polarisedimenticolia bacterium]|nr:DUF1343 domain-containing protein [Candidatus Polarisedimenticolia bacterium]